MGHTDELRALHRECMSLLERRRETEEALGRNISRQLEIIGADPHVLDGAEDADRIKETLGRAILP